MFVGKASSGSYEKLVNRYLDRVYSYLAALTHDPELARELAHDTFIKLRGHVSSGETLSEAYVFTAARNSALSAWRFRQSEKTKLDEFAAEEKQAMAFHSSKTHPARNLETKELREAMEVALSKMPELQRSVFLLSEIEGMKYGEIAEVLEIPEGTVGSRKNKAMQFMRCQLEDMGHAL